MYAKRESQSVNIPLPHAKVGRKMASKIRKKVVEFSIYRNSVYQLRILWALWLSQAKTYNIHRKILTSLKRWFQKRVVKLRLAIGFYDTILPDFEKDQKNDRSERRIMTGAHYAAQKAACFPLCVILWWKTWWYPKGNLGGGISISGGVNRRVISVILVH